jgi:hypothetical protein
LVNGGRQALTVFRCSIAPNGFGKVLNFAHVPFQDALLKGNKRCGDAFRFHAAFIASSFGLVKPKNAFPKSLTIPLQAEGKAMGEN